MKGNEKIWGGIWCRNNRWGGNSHVAFLARSTCILPHAIPSCFVFAARVWWNPTLENMPPYDKMQHRRQGNEHFFWLRRYCQIRKQVKKGERGGEGKVGVQLW